MGYHVHGITSRTENSLDPDLKPVVHFKTGHTVNVLKF